MTLALIALILFLTAGLFCSIGLRIFFGIPARNE